jgi:hypothetical protein
MKLVVGLSAIAVVLSAGCSSMPGSASRDAEEHAAHHPEVAATSPAPSGDDQQMKMMREMHQKMVAAKTPEERAALMKEHMKTMQDGMGTMKRRMDMMEMMMQLMMDREGMKPPAPK